MSEKWKLLLKNWKFQRKKNSFGKFTKGIIYDTANGIISMPHDDMMIGKRLSTEGAWNLKEIDLLKKIIHKEDVVYVVGTHVGTLLIPLSKHCRNIVGYEANPETFWFLKQNLTMNEVTNAEIFNLAIGDHKKSISFLMNKMNTGGSKIKPVKDIFKYRFDAPKEIEIPMISLDEHILEKDLQPPNGIIMDIEGAEFFALQGMPKTLKEIRFLYMEYVPHHLKNVSATTKEQLFELLKPYFARAVSSRKNIEFDLSRSPAEFLKYLDELEAFERVDDILFLKT
ncbi:FkbM family methyltransferase [Salinimicrobium sp. CDJ15-81-2]|nr:FkbM family methyltransferase [Salinimicrobium nanhaiense]